MSLSSIEFLKHIYDECEYLEEEYNSNSFEEFVNNKRLSSAFCRSLEIIDEASNKIDPVLKKIYPYIPWRELGDSRIKLFIIILASTMILFRTLLRPMFRS